MVNYLASASFCVTAFLGGCSREVGQRSPAPTHHARVVFAGDILLDEVPGKLIASGTDPFVPTAPWLSRADLTVGNLESPIAETGTVVPKVYQFRAHPRTLPTLAAHFGLVSLANNHSGDYGREALLETMRGLDSVGVPFTGAGNNLAEAHEPKILERQGLRIAILGYSEYQPRGFEAGHATPGVAWSEEEQVVADIHRAQQLGAQLVIPFLHWGWENEALPCQRQRDLARRLIDAGAAAVVGAHPHVTQGAEIYRGRPIIYSLGNFVFSLIDEERNAAGWLLRLDLDELGIARWDTVVVIIDERGVPSPKTSILSPCGLRGDLHPRDCSVQVDRVAADQL